MPSEDEHLDNPDEDEPGFLKELRRKAKERDQFEAELSSTKREVAVLSAGLGDLSDRQRKALLATHDGELTPDELRATALELGFVKAPEEPPEGEIPDAERAARQRVAQASAGAEPAGQPPDLAAQMKAARESGNREEFERLLNASGLVRQDS